MSGLTGFGWSVIGAAVAVAVLHTVLGPDHYLPFLMIGRARRWSALRTVIVTVVCGIGHVASSVLLGCVGLGLGWTVGRIQSLEGMRGSFSAWILGLRGDRRALPALRRTTEDSVAFVALEAAAATVRLGDDAGFERLVGGLEEEDPRLRARSLMVLQARTGSSMDFRADDPAEDRAAAVARWRAWLRSRREAGA